MAKQKLSRDQKRKQQRKQRLYSSQGNPMIRRLKEAGLDNYKIVQAPKHAAKMSEVLREFIEPYQEYAPTTEAQHRLIAIAIVAWNTALLPEAETGCAAPHQLSMFWSCAL